MRRSSSSSSSSSSSLSSSGSNNYEGIIWKRKGGEEEEEMVISNDSSSLNGYGNGIHVNTGCCSNKEKNKSNSKKKMKKKKKNESCYELVTYDELPEYMKDNEFILGYYRANWSIKAAFLSLFRWHNETLNVWTHLIGFVVFVWLTIANLIQVPQFTQLLDKFTRSISSITPGINTSINAEDFFPSMEVSMDFGNMSSELFTAASAMSTVTRWPFFVFLAGSMFCLLTSSICHLFCCHSHNLNVLLLRFDYVGITVMIITSFFPPMYYVFQCEPHWQLIYLTAITTMGIFTIAALLAPSASKDTSACRSFRATLFFAMGFSGIVPAIHATINNWNEPRRVVTLTYESAMALSYATGTFFYVSRIPERWKPGFFDLAGHSHQIFHVFVILGALAHYSAALIFLDWRGTVGCNRV